MQKARKSQWKKQYDDRKDILTPCDHETTDRVMKRKPFHTIAINYHVLNCTLECISDILYYLSRLEQYDRYKKKWKP